MTALFARIRSAAEAQLVGEAGFDGVASDDPIGSAGPKGRLWRGANGDRLVLVLDGGAPHAILAVTSDWHALPPAAGEQGLLLDPAARLIDQPGVAGLAAIRAQCWAKGLVCGFAGHIEPPDMPRLVALEPDVIVVSDAVRREGKTAGALDPAALRLMRDLVPARSQPVGPPPTPPEAPSAAAPRPDRIFMRDLVLPIAIGAYHGERGRTQRVRFTVEADVRAAGRTTRDMSDVVSYDLFSDAIHRLTRDRHIDFVETLAEEIATAVLADPRVLHVRVTVEKLDVGPGSVGIAIERSGRP